MLMIYRKMYALVVFDENKNNIRNYIKYVY